MFNVALLQQSLISASKVNCYSSISRFIHIPLHMPFLHICHEKQLGTQIQDSTLLHNKCFVIQLAAFCFSMLRGFPIHNYNTYWLIAYHWQHLPYQHQWTLQGNNSLPFWRVILFMGFLLGISRPYKQLPCVSLGECINWLITLTTNLISGLVCDR